ncbi:retrovirus-related pol polyprotein from transposon TNT 1-94 [Tanacetum coccineum]
MESAYGRRTVIPEQAQRDKDMQKNLALIAKYFKKIYKPTNNNLRTSSNTRNKHVDTTPRYKNDNHAGSLGHLWARMTDKPKRVKDSTYHKEKMLLCKQAEKGVQLQVEQSDWLADTDEEIDEQELEAHYSYMAKIQEVPNADSGTDAEPLEQVQYDTDDNVFANDIQHFEQSESITNTCVVETGDSNVIPDSPDMCDNDIQDDQTDVECDDKRVALSNLIANLKLDVDENKKIQKQLKKVNATLTQELTECKSILAETSRTLGESNSIRDINETLGLLSSKEIDIKKVLKVKAYEISVVQRLSHLNFDYINLLLKKDVMIGLPKLKYVKDHLRSSCEVNKEKRSSFKSKTIPSSKGRLNLLHMDLCGPMRVASINGKRYILVIVDDYSRYTWTLFLRSKDETPEVLKDFLTMIQRNLQALVISVRTDRGTEFLNKTLNAFFKEEGIELCLTITLEPPEQNGIVERRNRTLVEAARTMLSAYKLPLFFWAEAITTACYTQKDHFINTNSYGENLDKMKEKGDPCILVGYSTQSKGYRVYNKRTRLIVESIHLRFDEIKEFVCVTSVAKDTSGPRAQRQKAS